jgi:hypothetical protein
MKWYLELTVSFGSISAARRMANAWRGFRSSPDTDAAGEVWPKGDFTSTAVHRTDLAHDCCPALIIA